MHSRTDAKSKPGQPVHSKYMKGYSPTEMRKSPGKKKSSPTPYWTNEKEHDVMTEDDDGASTALLTDESDEFNESLDSTKADSITLFTRREESKRFTPSLHDRSSSKTPERKQEIPFSKQLKLASLNNGANEDVWKYLCVVLGILIIPVVCIFLSNKTAKPDVSDNSVEDLIHSIKHLQTKYHDQRPDTWKVIGSAVKAVIKFKSPKQPSTIMIATLKEAKNVVECLTKEIENMIRNLFDDNTDSVLIDGSKKNSRESVYNQLKNAFQNGVHLAVIDHFEKLPGEAVKILHTFCDHENAPYKNVIIMLIVRKELNETVLDVKNRMNSDNFVSNYLQELWNDSLGLDTSAALLSRIANRVALISPEKFETLKAACDI